MDDPHAMPGASERGDDAEPSRLARAEQLYARGDYRGLRPLARALAASAEPETAARARALLRALGPDPAHIGVLIACALAFLAVCWHYLAS
jgi:hypothetical protein